jgi:hypothetical protein
MLQWDFVQPSETANRSVDLLFVVDTSDSLKEERSRIASTIPSFVNQLSSETDYRIGVMLAHGGDSYYSGRLYSPPGIPQVLNSRTLSTTQIQSYLGSTLSKPVSDVDEANGEMMTYSLLKSLGSDRISTIQNQGFFRQNAALSVVFVSDENDICYVPNQHGYSAFPDFVPSFENTEAAAYKNYCVGKDNEELVTPDLVYSQLKAVKGSLPLSLGGITHMDPTQVPTGGEDSIGHGVIELVKSSLNGILMELTQTDYSDGLSKLGSTVTQQLHLLTQFGLTGKPSFFEDTVSVQVDGKSVESEYDSNTHLVSLRASDAGQSGSHVRVTACRK